MEISKDEAPNKTLIFEEMINLYSFFPNNKDFETKNIQISDEHNFSLIFHNFLLYLREIDKNFTEYIHKTNIKKDCYDIQLRSLILINNKSYDKELVNYIRQFWINQDDYNIYHTYMFLILADIYLNKNGDKFSEYDKNILYWTILFHDLGKHMNMNTIIKEKIKRGCRDKTHPFKSIIIFLNLAFENNLFYFPNDNYKNEILNFYKNEFITSIYKSWKLEKFKKSKLYNISFEYIDIFEKFFCKIKEQEKNEWIYDICILIIFHQSLPNNDDKMNQPLLEEKYIKIFFTKRLIELMRVIMIYDSASHCLFDGGKWTFQINKHVDELVKLFD